MKKIYVQSLPLKDAISDMSEGMNTGMSQDCDLYTLQIPKTLGQGTIQGMNFIGGIGFIIYDCLFKEDFEISFTVSKVHPAKFIYILSGECVHQFDNEKATHTLKQHQCAIVASSDHNGHILFFKKNQRIKLYSVETDRKVFLKKMRCEIDAIDNPLKELFLDTDAKNTFYHGGSYNLKLFKKLRELEDSSHRGFGRKMFWFSCALGVISEQLVNYRAEINMTPNDFKLMSGDVDLVKRSTDIMSENLASPVNILDLAKKLGSYAPKLQKAFKFVYGTTVNKYLIKLRLERAAELLSNSELNITDIVSEVGLVNRGYFARIFKDNYGTTPQTYRQKFKEQLLEK